ncbi:MAG: Sec-independent protein translocase subunit TatC [Gammaproteobacteria bacterium]|nr:MAG: Sec-independent protein translocase subunit TatC [Gammaproteobacteria bacterium]
MAEEQVDNNEPGFVSHLFELRDRLLKSLVLVILVFIAIYSISSQDLFDLLAKPMIDALPKGSTLVAIDIYTALFTPMKLAFFASLFICIPFLLYQLWAFVAPGLYKHEQKMVLPLMLSTTILFYLGVAFAYYLVFPMVFKFMVDIAPQAVKITPDIKSYMSSAFTMFFAFGAAFEVPVAVVLLVRMGVVKPETLASKRPYVVVAAFVIGMLLTPPDFISQIALAVPMLILFEIGLFVARRMKPKDTDDEDDNPSEEELAADLDDEILK